MRFLVRRAYSGWGYLASTDALPGESVHGVGFDEAIVELAGKLGSLIAADGTPPRLADLSLSLIREEYGQYVIEIARKPSS